MITQNLRAQLLYKNTKERGLFCMTVLKDFQQEENYYTKTLKRMRTSLLICIGTNEYKLQATSKLEN